MSERKDELAKIVGVENVSDDGEILEAYSRDHSFVRPMKPRLVVRPRNADEVQEIVKWANKTATPLVPVSSGPPRFRGDTVPSAGDTVMVDLSGMNGIIRIDRRNRMVLIEPGVTFGQLQPELEKEALKLSMPLLPRRNKSVIASLLEREPILIPKYQWTLLEPLRCLEVVWGNGSRLVTGDAGTWGPLQKQWEMKHAQVVPVGWGQVDYHRLVSGAQGSMGIVTWATVKCEVLPQIHEVVFVSSKRLGDLIDFAYKLLKIKYADEFLFLNNANLASILRQGTDQIAALREEIPPWVLVLGVAGRDRLPEERVEFQKKDIKDIAQQFGLVPSPTIPGVRYGDVLKALLTPCDEPYWKLRYKGGCQDIFFLTTLDRTPEFLDCMYSASEAQGYSPSEIGVYIQPLNRGVGCHYEFNLPYKPGNQREVTKVQSLFTKASQALINKGAYFSRPYGIWADMAYNKDAQSTIVLRKIKAVFDPTNVMNPGKLCF